MLIYNFQGLFTQIISFDPHNKSMKKKEYYLHHFTVEETQNPESMAKTGQLFTKLCLFSFWS